MFTLRHVQKRLGTELNIHWWRAGSRSLSAAKELSAETAIVAACVLCRYPLLRPLPPDWEIEYNNWAFERRLQKQKVLPPEFLEGKRRETKGGDEGEEERQKLEVWSPNPRVTYADQTGDTKSLMRLLEKHLFLLVKGDQGGGTSKWQFPSEINREGETIKQTGERALAAATGTSLDVFFKGNCPIGHLATKSEDAAMGEKIFFMEAQAMGGRVSLEASLYCDYAWAGKDEMHKFISDQQLLKLLDRMLPSGVPQNYFTLWDFFPMVREDEESEGPS